jgi:hypothetical protein
MGWKSSICIKEWAALRWSKSLHANNVLRVVFLEKQIGIIFPIRIKN